MARLLTLYSVGVGPSWSWEMADGARFCETVELIQATEALIEYVRLQSIGRCTLGT